jgi:hypothetical protein
VKGQGGYSYRETTQRGTRNAYNNQTYHAEGGVVGDDDEDDNSHNDDDDNETTTTMADAVGGIATTG